MGESISTIFEAFVIITGILWGLSILAVKVRKNSKNSPSVPVKLTDGTVQPERVVRAVRIEGASRFEGDRSFLNRFGVSPSEVQDLHHFKGPALSSTMPPKVLDCMRRCFEQGSIRGVEISGLVCRNESLKAGHSIYFALVEPTKAAPVLLAFVDQART